MSGGHHRHDAPPMLQVIGTPMAAPLLASLVSHLSGEATVTSDDGTTVELRPGATFVARAGWRGHWKVRQTVRKSMPSGQSRDIHPPAIRRHPHYVGLGRQSTPHFRAASACVSCCEVTSKNTSHFSAGDSCPRLRGVPFSIITSSWLGTPTASQDWRENRASSIAGSDANQQPLTNPHRSASPAFTAVRAS
jgi:EutQ-like cupin domain